jgi:hypothetical protein
MTESGEHLETVRILNDRDSLADVMSRAGECATRSGRLTSATSIPAACSTRVRPAP